MSTSLEQSYLKIVFDFFDTEKQGHINAKDIENALVCLGYEATQQNIEEIKQTSQGNHNKFKHDDLVNFCQKFEVKIPQIEKLLKEAFQTIESNVKGNSNSKNIEPILKLTKPDITEKEVKKLLKEMNPDAQGNFNYNKFVEDLIENTKAASANYTA